MHAEQQPKGRVLVVDDEEPVSRLLELWLIQENYTVRRASSFEEACDWMGRESFDLVTLDIVMPVVDGLQSLRWFREYHPEVGVVMATALGDMSLVIEAMRLGAYSYMVKPFKLELVAHELARALERQRLVAENLPARTGAEGGGADPPTARGLCPAGAAGEGTGRTGPPGALPAGGVEPAAGPQGGHGGFAPGAGAGRHRILPTWPGPKTVGTSSSPGRWGAGGGRGRVGGLARGKGGWKVAGGPGVPRPSAPPPARGRHCPALAVPGRGAGGAVDPGTGWGGPEGRAQPPVAAGAGLGHGAGGSPGEGAVGQRPVAGR
ncbi:MAG: response regulator [Candidatus Latescibacteria bacterium]|nr:response regulator [Candidatus Latescibacterota bacterium]